MGLQGQWIVKEKIPIEALDSLMHPDDGTGAIKTMMHHGRNTKSNRKVKKQKKELPGLTS